MTVLRIIRKSNTFLYLYFEKRGYSLEYYYQSNQGQSAAINNALKWVKGEFLAWPDSDDFIIDQMLFLLL